MTELQKLNRELKATNRYKKFLEYEITREKQELKELNKEIFDKEAFGKVDWYNYE